MIFASPNSEDRLLCTGKASGMLDNVEGQADEQNESPFFRSTSTWTSPAHRMNREKGFALSVESPAQSRRAEHLVSSERTEGVFSKSAWKGWMLRIQRLQDKDLEFANLEELVLFGDLLLRDDFAGHFREHWTSKWGSLVCEVGLGAIPGLDRSANNLAKPGAELDAMRLRAIINEGYINASSVPPLVALSKPLPSYIATQHPLPGTVGHFWRMVLAERPCCVVMLNGYDGHKVEKLDTAERCIPYWSPTEVRSVKGLTLEELSQQRAGVCGQEVVVRHLRIALEEDVHTWEGDRAVFPDGMGHEVRHILADWWLDQSAPPAPHFFQLWRIFQAVLLNAPLQPRVAPKVVVHCAGGIGRTAVFIAADMCARAWSASFSPGASLQAGFASALELEPLTQQLLGERRGILLSPDAAIRYLRSRRANMLQTEEQYHFLHRAIPELVGYLESPEPGPLKVQRSEAIQIVFSDSWLDVLQAHLEHSAWVEGVSVDALLDCEPVTDTSGVPYDPRQDRLPSPCRFPLRVERNPIAVQSPQFSRTISW